LVGIYLIGKKEQMQHSFGFISRQEYRQLK